MDNKWTGNGLKMVWIRTGNGLEMERKGNEMKMD